MLQWTQRIKGIRLVRAIPMAKQKATSTSATNSDKLLWKLLLQAIQKQEMQNPTQSTRPLIILDFISKAVEFLQLPQILTASSVKELLSTQASNVIKTPSWWYTDTIRLFGRWCVTGK